MNVVDSLRYLLYFDVMKNSMLCLLGLLLASQSFAAARTLTCNTQSGNGPARTYLTISYDGNKISALSIDSYRLIENGTAAEQDPNIGPFNIKIGALQKQAGLTSLNLNLQDYSDVLGWKVFISEDSGNVSVVSTFESSDGDSKTHIHGFDLTCKSSK